MTGITHSFDTIRGNAARDFAQTMIIVDDEASQSSEPTLARKVGTLQRPDRRTAAARSRSGEPTPSQQSLRSGEHSLDAKSIVDKSMELGLLCSVVRPKQEEDFHQRVLKAAAIADIVCFDWEIHDDGGDAASKLIGRIVRNDAEGNGRLRLIAIYTGDTTNRKILGKAFEAIPKRIRHNQGFRERPLHIESDSGTRIVCLFKTHGIQIQDSRSQNQISEWELPGRLLEEFSTLSEGLLSGVALATAGSIRRSTHHVLSQFIGEMDGPYFHHRAMLESPEDAEEYAIDVVLSQFGNCINKEQLGPKYAGSQAIRARIEEISGNPENLALRFPQGKSSVSTYELEKDVSIRMVQDGFNPVHGTVKSPNPPGKKVFERYFSTLFSDSLGEARSRMHRFAALTGVRAHPQHHLFKLRIRTPKLGLGTIIQSKNREFLLCLQAACDSVRVEGKASFLFVPLEQNEDAPEHVVPISGRGRPSRFVGLSTTSGSYRLARSIFFHGAPTTRTVNAEKLERRSGYFFSDVSGEPYRWIADLKHRRALRTAQNIAQDMGRLGFDEFEPYRRRSRR